MIQKVTYYTSMITIILALMMLGYVGYLMFWPFKTVEVNQPYSVNEKVLEPGDMLSYTFDYCRFTDVKAEVHHQLRGRIAVDINKGITYRLVGGGLRIRKGCGKITKGVVLPDNLLPGTYYLQENIAYPINALRTIYRQFRTENFEVIPSDGMQDAGRNQ